MVGYFPPDNQKGAPVGDSQPSVCVRLCYRPASCLERTSATGNLPGQWSQQPVLLLPHRTARAASVRRNGDSPLGYRRRLNREQPRNPPYHGRHHGLVLACHHAGLVRNLCSLKNLPITPGANKSTSVATAKTAPPVGRAATTAFASPMVRNWFNW